jgi:hypothetical protein
MPHLLEFVLESIIVDVLRAPLRYQRFSKSISKLHAALVTAAAMNRHALAPCTAPYSYRLSEAPQPSTTVIERVQSGLLHGERLALDACYVLGIFCLGLLQHF